MRLFKEDNSSYYAYYRINGGIRNAGYLYYFNSKNGKLAKLCKLENGVVVRVKNLICNINLRDLKMANNSFL